MSEPKEAPKWGEVFALRVRQRMEELGIGPTTLAKKMGIPPQNIHAYLKGDRNPTIRTVESYARALGVDARWLTDSSREEEPRWREPTPEELTSRVVARLGLDQAREEVIQFVLSARPEQVDALLKEVKRMAETTNA